MSATPAEETTMHAMGAEQDDEMGLHVFDTSVPLAPADDDTEIGLHIFDSSVPSATAGHAPRRNYRAVPSEDYAMGYVSHDNCIVQQHSKKPRRQKAKKHRHPQGIRPPRPEETKRN